MSRAITSVEDSQRYMDVIIEADASLSEAIAVDYVTITGIERFANWTAADITFSVSNDGATFTDLYDSTGTEVKVTTGSGARMIALSAGDYWPVRFLKIRSGTSATPVVQVAARALRLTFRR